MKKVLAGQPRRLGILGGTFNPVHNGHLIIADAARRALKLDRVVFIPSSEPPHKQGLGILDFNLRYRMLEEAIADNTSFAVSDIEHRREGFSFTVDTLRSIREMASENVKIFFLIGSDNLSLLDTWREPEKIVSLCSLVSLTRPGRENGTGATRLDSQITFLDVPQIDISATMIRDLVAAGESVRYLVPPTVEQFIRKNNIYRR